MLWSHGTSDIRCWTAVQHSILAVPATVARRRESLWPGIKILSMPGQSPLQEFQAPAVSLHEVMLVDREHGWQADLTVEMG